MLEQTCPCCGSTLLCHMRNGGAYWLCSGCRQEMPLFADHRQLPLADQADVEILLPAPPEIVLEVRS